MKCRNFRSMWACCVKFKSRIKRFCHKINHILYRATKWINLFLTTPANKLSPDLIVIWNRAWPPRFWYKFGSFAWNCLQSKALPETFHNVNINVFFTIRRCIWLNGFTKRFPFCGNKSGLCVDMQSNWAYQDMLHWIYYYQMFHFFPYYFC